MILLHCSVIAQLILIMPFKTQNSHIVLCFNEFLSELRKVKVCVKLNKSGRVFLIISGNNGGKWYVI